MYDLYSLLRRISYLRATPSPSVSLTVLPSPSIFFVYIAFTCIAFACVSITCSAFQYLYNAAPPPPCSSFACSSFTVFSTADILYHASPSTISFATYILHHASPRLSPSSPVSCTLHASLSPFISITITFTYHACPLLRTDFTVSFTAGLLHHACQPPGISFTVSFTIS